MTERWPCQYYASTTAADGTYRRLGGWFEGAGAVVSNAEQVLSKRLRKPHLWDGVELTIVTPLGQRVIRTIRSSREIRLVK